jgi:hypothetical protein
MPTTTAITSTAPVTALAVLVVKPPRYNFAGFCIYCYVRGCTAERCVRLHTASAWQLCPACHGTGNQGEIDKCDHCLHGVRECTPTTPGAVR